LANLRSAKKRIRQNAKRRMRNRIYRTRARTFVKHARIAINTGDSEAATDAVRKAVSELDRASSKGVIHRKNAARRKSRLMKRLASLEQST
jgi:small subunit ribosomal protein S20